MSVMISDRTAAAIEQDIETLVGRQRMKDAIRLVNLLIEMRGRRARARHFVLLSRLYRTSGRLVLAKQSIELANSKFPGQRRIQKELHAVEEAMTHPPPARMGLHLPLGLDVSEFAERLKKKSVRYVILRWFDDLPKVDGDIEILVHDDDYEKLREELVFDASSDITVHAYTIYGVRHGRYNGMPCYPPHLAERIVKSRILFKELFYVPDAHHHFMSFCYHAIYHKRERSGLRYSSTSERALNPRRLKHDFEHEIRLLATSSGYKVVPCFLELHEFLSQHGWGAPLDWFRRLGIRSDSLREMYPTPGLRPDSGQLTVFVVRDGAYEAGWLSKVVGGIRGDGFFVIAVHELNEAQRSVASRHVRGGNWHIPDDVDSEFPGPAPNGPAALVVAWDPKPAPVLEDMRQRHPFLQNSRILETKMRLRELMTSDLEPFRGQGANSLHASDDELEAWEMIKTILPDRKDDIAAAVSRYRES